MSATSFDPKADARAFRAALGNFVTGITLVTTEGADGPTGMVVNSFTSVSLDPPLVLWCPAKSSSRIADFENNPHFAIHILADHQRDLAKAFVNSKSAFDDIPWTRSETGVPLVQGALSTFECSLHSQHDAGDHLLILGEVTKCLQNEGVPLIYHAGKYAAL